MIARTSTTPLPGKAGKGTHTADAYSSIAVVSALVFGFATSTLTTALVELDVLDRPLLQAFALVLVLVIATSGFATCTLALQYYYIKRIFDDEMVHGSALGAFIDTTLRSRSAARVCTWLSLATYVGSLALLGIEMVPPAIAIPFAAIAVCGAVSIAASYALIHRAFVQSFPQRRFKHPFNRVLAAAGSQKRLTAGPRSGSRRRNHVVASPCSRADGPAQDEGGGRSACASASGGGTAAGARGEPGPGILGSPPGSRDTRWV